VSFISEALKNSYHTGSVWPSSKALAHSITRSFREKDGPRKILEVGPGSGPFTKVILDSLRAGDEYHLVEINDSFCKGLQEKFIVPYLEKAEHPANVELHQGAIEDVTLPSTFDFTVCGLPFNNFPPTVTRSIFRQLLALTRKEGDLAYFEYAAVRKMRGAVVGSDGRSKIKRIDAHGKSMLRRFEGHRELVFANLPPAYVIRLRGLGS
jgi:phospholipid N-methyltransferase